MVVLSDSATAPSISELKDNGIWSFALRRLMRTKDSRSQSSSTTAGIKKVAMTYSNDDYNAGIAQVFEREYKKMGGTITWQSGARAEQGVVPLRALRR